MKPDVVIFWVNLKYLYLFPTLLITKALGLKTVYWGHGCDLEDLESEPKKMAYALEHWICDAIILYAEHLTKYVSPRFHYKVFVANNTLNFASYSIPFYDKNSVLAKYGINTHKNIICMARMEKRKRIDDLIKAFDLLNYRNYGLILVGPDTDGILKDVQSDNIYKLGPVYGEESLALLSSADVYCLPGHIGLSIVDAFYCGLPIVTEDTENAPEIIYLKNGINGFIVPKSDVHQLAIKLQLLLENDILREQFSQAARNEIMTNGHIKVMCEGFAKALQFVCDIKSSRRI
ncbi:MAG: glycosyltransferase family 4 protein [Candidatus Hodarchaeota archaeon]